MKARIVANEFILYWETKILIGPSVTCENVRPMGLDLCPHLTSSYHRNRLFHMIKCQFSHTAARRCDDCIGLKQCHFCPMEFTIDLYCQGAEGYVLIATTWKNFGSGRSLQDPKWWRHVRDHLTNGDDLYQPEPFEFRPGSIRSAFETQGE